MHRPTGEVSWEVEQEENFVYNLTFLPQQTKIRSDCENRTDKRIMLETNMEEQRNQDNHRTIVLISCCGPKAEQPSKAKDLYISQLFKLSLTYARKIADDSHIFILSAKHELVGLNNVIAPYNVTLSSMPVSYRRQWSENVLNELAAKGFDLEKDKFVILAGNKYIDYLVKGRKRPSLGCKQIRNAVLPLNGMPFGYRLKTLKSLI